MILHDLEYAAPESVVEAVTLLTERGGGRALAGGQSLLADLKSPDLTSGNGTSGNGRSGDGRSGAGTARGGAPFRLVDLRRIPRLHGIDRSAGGTLRIGAMTTLAEIAESAVVWAANPSLADAAAAVGDPQVRNRGTIGGNIATRDRPTDLPAVALSGLARLHLTGPGGDRTASAEEYFAANGEDGGDAGHDLIVSVEFPALTEREMSVFNKIADRAARSPLSAVAVWAECADDGGVMACRIGVVGATRRPTRLHGVEAALADTLPTAETIRAAIRAVPVQEFVDDEAASAAYRAHLTNALVQRSFDQILAN
jgi:carbon-monoxide dehydrogenase medium subunit